MGKKKGKKKSSKAKAVGRNNNVEEATITTSAISPPASEESSPAEETGTVQVDDVTNDLANEELVEREEQNAVSEGAESVVDDVRNETNVPASIDNQENSSSSPQKEGPPVVSLEEKLSDPDEKWEDAQETIDDEPETSKDENSSPNETISLPTDTAVEVADGIESPALPKVEAPGDDTVHTEEPMDENSVNSKALDILSSPPQTSKEELVAVDIQRANEDTRIGEHPIQSIVTPKQPIHLDGRDIDQSNGHAVDGNSDSGETATTFVDEMPLFHYSRIASASLLPPEGTKTRPQHSCSKLSVIRVDPEELIRAAANNHGNTQTTIANTPSFDSATIRNNPSHDENASVHSTASMDARTHRKEQSLLLSSDLWKQPHWILANATSSSGAGKIIFTRIQSTSVEQKKKPNPKCPCVVFATTSSEIGGASGGNHKYLTVSRNLSVRENSDTAEEVSVVDLSFDSSGSVLGAIDEGGHCTIWEFKYTTSLQSNALVFGEEIKEESVAPPQTSHPEAVPARPAGLFSNFMSALTGIPPADEILGNGSVHGVANSSRHGTNARSTLEETSNTATREEVLVPTLTAEFSQPSRVNYPLKWGPPTCMVLDPAYKNRREKSIVVGFANGQLYLTRKGTFFQRRNDTILYQAPSNSTSNGIEAIVWRGPLLAFADSTGIKLMDMDNVTRIAHIDRPGGANPSLYPLLTNIRPSLFFETSQHLLVGWGDCLLQIHVEEHTDDEVSTLSAGAASNNSNTEPKKKRRTVACTMAWELDCVACDVVPLDKETIAVLGLVSLADDDDLMLRDTPLSSAKTHDLELQILSRSDGTIPYSDSLPLVQQTVEEETPIFTNAISVRDFRLLSSFALPRMEDNDETKALRAQMGANDMGFIGIDVNFDMNQPLFADSDSFTKRNVTFKDPHLQWQLDSIVYNDQEDYGESNSFSDDENSSIDSDDYECILRPMESTHPLSISRTNGGILVPAPTMVVCTNTDAILSLPSTIDDAIEDSLDRQKYALALTRGLSHKRQLRRYKLDDLIDFYLKAVLRISEFDEADQESMILPELSLRRMQLAVKAMPVLLGDRIEMWKRWSSELGKIPGALFLLRNYLPVRDPILPSIVYESILETMLEEVEQLSDPSLASFYTEASDHFLESILAWGPTKVLKDFISFYKYNRERRTEGKKSSDKAIRSTEISLQRRYLQTAAGYLIFPVRDIEEEVEVTAPKYEIQNVDTEDSLFNISNIERLLIPRVPLVALSSDKNFVGKKKSRRMVTNNHTCLEAMARLRMMQGDYDLALKCYLAIGACHAKDPLSYFEQTAVEIVNGNKTSFDEPPSRIGDRSYEFVMHLIESHELNQFLFEPDFLLATDSKLFMPIFALIRLVGLRRVGTFLMDHCVAAGFSYTTNTIEELVLAESTDDLTADRKEILRRGSLPLDKVAQQLENSPAILHWYLHMVFTRRPDFYVQFPTNSIPSKAVTSLHRKHFQLYVDFAGENRDSSKVLAGIEAYKVESKTTPLLTFLKAALPLGGILPIDARRILEIEREDDSMKNDIVDVSGSQTSSSPVFAIELAYIIEKYSEQTEAEALGVLNLYLKGAKSLPLSVSYAQRQKQFSAKLWDHLISHCLKEASDGRLFGEMLEAAALCGADLARLVARIPPGMIVEGLRPRLVAAVADYRMKLEIYEAAIAAGSEEEVTLMREIGQRVRRGVRYDLERNQHKSFAELIHERAIREGIGTRQTGARISNEEESKGSRQKLSKTQLRRDHVRLMYSIPRR